MHAIYQQRRIEKVNPKGLGGLGIPFIYGSSIPVGPATYHGRGMLPPVTCTFTEAPWETFRETPW